MGVKPKVIDYAAVDGKWAYASGGAMVWQDIPGLITPDAEWKIIGTDIPFENGWGHYPSPDYAPARFRKLNDSLVVLEGLIGSTGGTAGAPAFTMPPGYRPATNVSSDRISHWFTASSYIPPWGTFWVYSDGRVQPEHDGTVYLCLDAIKYYADH
jgi:hypothetical protein